MKFSKKLIIASTVLLSVLFSVGATIWYIKSVDRNPVRQTSSKTEQPPEIKKTAADTTENRLQDAGKFMTAITEFQIKNKGGIPVSYVNNELIAPSATPVKYEFIFFEGVDIVRAKQDPMPTDSKKVRMVLQAKCSQDGGTEEVPLGIVSLQFSDGMNAKCYSSR